MHEKLAAAVAPIDLVSRAKLHHILGQPVVNMPEKLPIAGLSEFHQQLVGDGLLGGIYAGPEKNLVSCEDAVYFLTTYTEGTKVKIVVQADGVSGTPCAITYARLLVNEVGTKLTRLAGHHKISQKAIIATIIEAAKKIPRYFQARFYPYQDLLDHPNFKQKAKLKDHIQNNKSVAGATLNIVVEINNRIYVAIIGDGIFGIYHPQYGHRYALGMSFSDYPEQFSASSQGLPVSDPNKLLGGYLECSVDEDDRWILTTDGPLQNMSRDQFHRIMKKRVDAGESLDLHDHFKYNALDDCVFVTNAT